MEAQRKALSFKGQNIYIGIDVHLKSWSVTLMVTVPAAPSCRERRRFIPSRKNGKDEKETRNSPGQKTWPQISIC